MNFLLKLCLTITLITNLFACTEFGSSDQKEIEAIVVENLIDPESVRFSEFLISTDGNRACIEYNAKNRFGGYIGQSFARFKKQYGTWVIDSLDSSSYSCSPSGFKASDAIHVAYLKGKQTMIAALQEAPNISEADANKLAYGETITVDGEEVSCTPMTRAEFSSILRELDSKESDRKEHLRQRFNLFLHAFKNGVCPNAFGADNETLKRLTEVLIRAKNKE